MYTRLWHDCVKEECSFQFPTSGGTQFNLTAKLNLNKQTQCDFLQKIIYLFCSFNKAVHYMCAMSQIGRAHV